MENNAYLDDTLKDMQQQYILLQRNIKFKNQKDTDLNAQRIYETNRIKLKEYELEKLKDKFERTKVIKRDKSEEIKKLEAQNKQYE